MKLLRLVHSWSVMCPVCSQSVKAMVPLGLRTRCASLMSLSLSVT